MVLIRPATSADAAGWPAVDARRLVAVPKRLGHRSFPAPRPAERHPSERRP